MTVRRWMFLSVPIGLLLTFTSTVLAQLNRGVIEGSVTDPQGAAVPDVSVVITALNTNVTQTTKTNSAGYYRAVDLVPGTYRARLVASGFAPEEIKDIEVTAGQVIRISVQLKIKTVAEAVTITAESPVLQTEASNFNTTVSNDMVQNLPLAGRDLQQLVFLIPGVNNVGGPPGSNFGFNSEFGTFPDPTHLLGSAVAVNGGQSGANAWYLDGNLNVSDLGENIVVNPTPDSVAQFQAITDAFSAEYGNTGGAVFNVVLKSGTEAVHGNLYEYLRNDATNARNPFTQIGAGQPTLRFNNFGGTVGGPVVIPHLYNGKHKTFFFFSMDATILHQLLENVYNVPTPLMRQGNFIEDPNVAANGIYDPFTSTGPDVNGNFKRIPFMNGSSLATAIPKNRLDPTAMFFINSFPLPNHVDSTGSCPPGAGAFSICNNFLASQGSSQDTINLSIKIDHQTSEKSHYFGEWLFSPTRYDIFRFPWTGATFPQEAIGLFGSGPYNFDNHNQIIGLGHTYIFNPSLTNEFRFNFSRQMIDTHPTHPFPDSVTDQSGVEKVLAPSRLPTNPLFPIPNFDIGGGAIQFGSAPWVNETTGAEAYTILDNVTRIIGRHTLKTGFLYSINHGIFLTSSPTILGFDGALTANAVTGLGGNALAQFELGAVPASSSVNFTGRLASPYTRWRRWAFYFQDDFHITSNFTLNVGLRYDINGYWNTRYTPMGNFCLTCFNPLTGLKGEAIYSGDPGFPKGGDILPANHKSFGPRLNFAWSPFGDRKTVVRGGYDIFYSDALQNANAPGQSAVNGTGWARNGTWETTFPAFAGQCLAFDANQCVAFPLSDTTTDKATLTFPTIGGLFPAQTRENTLGQIYYFNKPSIDPMVQSWTLEIQRELPGNLAISVAYVGSHGTHLPGTGPNNFIFNFVPTADVLNPVTGRTHLNDIVPITNFFSGQTAKELGILNADPLTGAPATALPRSVLLLPFPFFSGGLDTNDTYDGTSIYHAMNLRIDKRYSHGLDLIVAYTVSKKFVNWSTGGAGVNVVDPIHFFRGGEIGGRGGAQVSTFGGATSFQDPSNKRLDSHQFSVDDIPQILNIGGTYELPVGSGKALLNRKGFLNGVLGGWKLSGNFNAESGLPLSIYCPASSLQQTVTPQLGSAEGRCNLIGDPHFHGHRSKAQRIADWINPAAFEPAFGSDPNFWANFNPDDPRAWTFGNAAIRAPGGIRSPGFWNIDSSLSKQFHLTEAKYFELRWDVFNTLNHQNLGIPNTFWCLPVPPGGTPNAVQTSPCTFGQITTIQTDPRAMQFALKFYY